MQRMQWKDLLVRERFHSSGAVFDEPGRTGFRRDLDRLVFSGAFRRLQGKTQVHTFPKNDHIHNRLTHSLEVASVGRTLGTLVGIELKERSELPEDISPDDVGAIVQAACIAHDIGNPPFGHACETAIGEWLGKWIKDKKELYGSHLSEEEIKDLTTFDGNAQGFRVITRIEQHFNDGGMRLSYPTLAAFLKYPWIPSTSPENKKNKSSAFLSEKSYLKDICSTVKLIELKDTVWCRSPLAYLVEAADDICYNFIDVEDGIELGILGVDDYKDLINKVTNGDGINNDYNPGQARKYFSANRGKIFDDLIQNTINSFFSHYEEIMSGQFEGDLIQKSGGDVSNILKDASDLCKKRIFTDRKKTIIEIGVYKNVDVTLGTLCNAVTDYVLADKDRSRISSISKKVLDHVESEGFTMPDSLHECLRGAVDYVSGMTDNYATYVARQFSGLVE